MKLLKWLLGFDVDFSGKEEKSVYQGDELDKPLFWFNDDDPFTLRQSHEGVTVLGSTGSGKSSGSGKKLAKSFLENDFGGLVLCVKRDEKDTWIKYCQETGRQDDLIIFSPENTYRFNFLDYEASLDSSKAGLTLNLAQLFQTVSEISRRNEGASNQDFWAKTLQELIKNTIGLITLAGKQLSVQSMLEAITSAPQSVEQLNEEYFRQTSFCFECIQLLNEKMQQSPSRDASITYSYWISRYPSLAEKTRSIIDVSFSAMADNFLRGVLGELFTTESNISPEDCYKHGKIILVDLSVHEYRELGQMAQILWKYCFQRAMERRDVKQYPRSVFIFGDEYQYLYSSKDSLFQTTARSLRVSVVAMSQNLSNFYSVLGGENKKSEVDSLFGNFNTKIFHAQSEERTQMWASNMIGRDHQAKVNMNFGGKSPSFSLSENIEHTLMPIEFTTLKKGGFENDLIVEGIVFQNGRIFSNNQNFIKVDFKQA